jgi:hypothetical protein
MSTHSEQLGELATALSAAQGEFGAIPKDTDNPFFGSKFSSLATVRKVSAPVLAKHGLSVSQWIGFDETGDLLTTVLLHNSGQFISDTMRLHLVKIDPQSQGSATTYAKRYSYMAALGLVSDDDDDGSAAMPRQERRPQARSNMQRAEAPQPTAKPPQATARPVNTGERGLINARAGARGLAPSALANVILVATGSEERDWKAEEDAQAWLKRALDRLPAGSMDAVLRGIEQPEEATSG